VTSKYLREWPLAVILAAQIVLTLPWLWRTAPFTDEALYIEAGHQVWDHWLHGASLLNYASWFSGAPVVYPPIGAAADSVGGLAAARTVSLIFMIGATCAVYFTGLRLFGRISGFFGAALFAVTGLIVHYGAFATYDAPALFFMAVAMWAAIHIREGGTRWLAICAIALVLANAFKYATLAWDPVIIGFVLVHNWDSGIANAIIRAASLTSTVVILAGGLLLLAGQSYVRGLIATTVIRTIRSGAYVPPSTVLWRAFALTGVLVLIGMAAVILSIVVREPLPVTCSLALFVFAGVIAPINQARIHELTSLDKNMGFGLVFAGLAAGYAMEAAIKTLPARIPAARLPSIVFGTALVLLVLILGRVQHVQFRGPSVQLANQIVSAIKHSYRPGTYILASGGSRMEQYYLPQIPSSAWMGIFAPNDATSTRFHNRICNGQVSLVVMRIVNGSYDHAYDYRLRSLLDSTHRYRIILKANGGPSITQVWQFKAVPGGAVCT
jgi:hypothetical protein